MKIQLTKTKTIEWTPPWEKTTLEVSDVVGIELESGNPDGCPAVRIQRRKDGLAVVAAGFIPPPPVPMPTDWNELGEPANWQLPSAFRAEHAAIAINSPDSYTRQTALSAIRETAATDGIEEGVASSKDGVRCSFRAMADGSSAMQAGLPEYQALWISRLFGERRRPIMSSAQTAISATLSALTAQPGFCEGGDEFVVFVFETAIFLAAYRDGLPLLFRDCPGVEGTSAMREAVKRAFGIDDAMVETVFSNNGIIDTRPAIAPLLLPIVSQIEFSIDYLKNRLGSSVRRLIVVGEPAGCAAFKRAASERISLPVHSPGVFEGLALPTRSVEWKERCCTGDAQLAFMTAVGAALSVLEEAKAEEAKAEEAKA